jgi:hypothetical protein
MATRKKGPVLRVTGLAASQPDEELTTSLEAAIHDNLTIEEQSKIGVKVIVVPSCYDDGERMALVEFPGGVPTFLAALTVDPLEEWQVEMGNVDVSFDQHFFGFTQLYTPQPGSPVTAEYVAFLCGAVQPCCS